MRKPQTEIGSFIRSRRKERGLTQQQLASHAELSFTFVNRVENGDLNLRVSSLNKLLNIFGFKLGPVPVPRASKESIKTGEN